MYAALFMRRYSRILIYKEGNYFRDQSSRHGELGCTESTVNGRIQIQNTERAHAWYSPDQNPSELWQNMSAERAYHGMHLNY